MASRHKHLNTYDTVLLQKVLFLDRVEVNRGGQDSTVTIQFAETNGPIAVIDSSAVGSRVYNRSFGGFGADLEIVVAGMSPAPDVTVLYD